MLSAFEYNRILKLAKTFETLSIQAGTLAIPGAGGSLKAQLARVERETCLDLTRA
jgi:hypothetical protein